MACSAAPPIRVAQVLGDEPAQVGGDTVGVPTDVRPSALRHGRRAALVEAAGAELLRRRGQERFAGHWDTVPVTSLTGGGGANVEHGIASNGPRDS